MGRHNETELTEINLSALRVITGCKSGTSHQKLYDETNLPTLRHRQLVAVKVALFDVYYESRRCRINRQSLTIV